MTANNNVILVQLDKWWQWWTKWDHTQLVLNIDHSGDQMLERKKIKDGFSSFDSSGCLLIAIASFTHFNKTKKPSSIVLKPNPWTMLHDFSENMEMFVLRLERRLSHWHFQLNVWQILRNLYWKNTLQRVVNYRFFFFYQQIVCPLISIGKRFSSWCNCSQSYLFGLIPVIIISPVNHLGGKTVINLLS